MINYIFGFVFVIGLIYSIFTNRIDITINALLATPKEALYLFLDIYVSLIFWGGIIEICKSSGLLRIITNYITILIHPFFKKLDKNNEALQYISVNIVSNLNLIILQYGAKLIVFFHFLTLFHTFVTISERLITLTINKTSFIRPFLLPLCQTLYFLSEK